MGQVWRNSVSGLLSLAWLEVPSNTTHLTLGSFDRCTLANINILAVDLNPIMLRWVGKGEDLFNGCLERKLLQCWKVGSILIDGLDLLLQSVCGAWIILISLVLDLIPVLPYEQHSIPDLANKLLQEHLRCEPVGKVWVCPDVLVLEAHPPCAETAIPKLVPSNGSLVLKG